MDHSRLTIPRVYDAYGEAHEVANMDQISIASRILDREFFRCGNCGEDLIFKAGGPKRHWHFAHYRMIDGAPACSWRTYGHATFSERNRSGDDGAWHIDVQIDLLKILEGMGVAANRNATVTEHLDQRRPDVSCILAGQEIRFEVQASLPDIQSMQRRSCVDIADGVVTIWIVSAKAVEEEGLQAWQENLLLRGGGQLWAWDKECTDRSERTGRLMIKRILGYGSPHIVDFEEQLPINLGYRCKASVKTNQPKIEFFSKHQIDVGRIALRQLAELKSYLADEAERRRTSQHWPYAFVQGNALVCVPDFRIRTAEPGPQAKKQISYWRDRWNQVNV